MLPAVWSLVDLITETSLCDIIAAPMRRSLCCLPATESTCKTRVGRKRVMQHALLERKAGCIPLRFADTCYNFSRCRDRALNFKDKGRFERIEHVYNREHGK
jgi:hypothetical protein